MQVYTVRTRRHRLGAEPPVVVAASIAHESEFTVVLGVAHEVGAVVKASITSAAQAVFVFVTFDVALFFGEFEARYMFYRKHGYGGSVSSSSPVVRSSSSHFVRSFGRLFVSSTTIHQYWKSISILFIWKWNCVDNKKNLVFCFCCFTGSNTIYGQTAELVCRVLANEEHRRAPVRRGNARSTNRR